MNGFTDRLTDVERSVTLRNGDGSPVFAIPAVYGIAAGVVAVLVAPRATAIAAIAALTRHMSITVDRPAPADAEPA